MTAPRRRARAAACGLLAAGVLLGAAPAGAEPQSEAPFAHETREIPVAPSDDARIAARLRDIYAEIPGLESVKVRVRQGVVHLSGEVGKANEEQLAKRIASRLEDVVYVDADLTPPRGLGLRLRPAGQRVRSFLAGLVDALPVLLLSIGVFVLVWLLGRWIGRWRRPFERLGLTTLKARLVASILRWAVVVAGAVLVLNLLDVLTTVGAVVGALGLVGVALGFAFRDVISSYLPGLLMSLNPPFDVGDRVRVADHEGHVVALTARDTVLLAVDGVQLRIPNSVIFQGPLLNLTRNPKRRLDFTVPLPSNVDLRSVRDVGRQALLKLDGVLSDPPPFMRIQAITDAFVEVRFFAWVDQTTARFLDLESRARRAVVEGLRSAGVETPVLRIGLEPAQAPSQGPGGALDDDSAEARAERFLADEVRSARARSSERDLLDEARSGATRPRR